MKVHKERTSLRRSFSVTLLSLTIFTSIHCIVKMYKFRDIIFSEIILSKYYITGNIIRPKIYISESTMLPGTKVSTNSVPLYQEESPRCFFLYFPDV